jgi:flagellar assembly protein FliH
MDVSADISRSDVLFAEDFDLPEDAPDPEVIEPEVIEPTFSIAELTEARKAAWREGHAAGVQAAAADSVAAVHETVLAISTQLAAERDVAAARAEQSATAIARLLLDSLNATFPVLCERYGNAEARSVMRIVLPALTQEPAITVRSNPRTERAVAEEVARLDPDLSARVQTIACEEMAPGDVHVTWRNGAATRDAAALWEQVLRVLAPIKEMIDGR